MGNISSFYQRVEVSANRKWIILPDCGAYINVNCVAFFVVTRRDDDGACSILFKLVDNDNDESSDGWESWAGQPISKFESTTMSRADAGRVIDALTK